MYKKLLKCPRPSLACKKVALCARDFLPEKCTSSICQGKLREIVKARTRRFFRSTFQSRSGKINPPIIYYCLCFDLVVKSLFLATINMVFNEYSPPPFQWNKLHAITQECKYFPHPMRNRSREINRHPFLTQGTNPKGVPF